MDEYHQLMGMQSQTLADIHAGGELSLLHQTIDMKKEYNKIMLEKTQKQQMRLDSLTTQLKQLQQQNPEPESKISSALQVLEDVKKCEAELQKLQTQRDQLAAEFANLRDNRSKITKAKLTEAQSMEKCVQLYHQLTGVFWEDDKTGYVLSEELAKPIRYCDDLEGTDQLWEMIDM